MTLEYSPEANKHLDDLQNGPDPDLWNAVVDALELIEDNPSEARSKSKAFTTKEGIRMQLPVAGYDHKVFWSTAVPRIEAVLYLP